MSAIAAPLPSSSSVHDPSEPPVLGVVVPCYNEEEVLPETARRLSDVLAGLRDDGLVHQTSFVLYVDDGSKDRTWALIEELHRADSRVGGRKLARNAGHQKALLAGLMRAKDQADCIISIDADLQDDVEAIREFVLAFGQGYDVVYGVRRSRDTDTVFKRGTAQGFYRFMRTMDVDIVYNHADYRLLSRRALQHLADFGEVNLFLRGLVTLVGFPSTVVEYDRHERFAGESKYPLRKMLAFAMDGVTSFSITPIRWVTGVGLAFVVLSLLAVLYAIVAKLLGDTVPGWSSLIASVWFIGGVQLVALGLIGEYVGKIYQEVKHRPRYIVEADLYPTGGAQA
jgi:glycosyltransferase involved in cell wall biosynthesis